MFSSDAGTHQLMMQLSWAATIFPVTKPSVMNQYASPTQPFITRHPDAGGLLG